jgi:nitrogen regulatory protein PII
VRSEASEPIAPPPAEGEQTEVPAFEKKMRIEIFCLPPELTTIIETIRKAAHTGNPGDGKIFAGPVTLASRIRTGEWGENATLGGRP